MHRKRSDRITTKWKYADSVGGVRYVRVCEDGRKAFKKRKRREGKGMYESPRVGLSSENNDTVRDDMIRNETRGSEGEAINFYLQTQSRRGFYGPELFQDEGGGRRWGLPLVPGLLANWLGGIRGAVVGANDLLRGRSFGLAGERLSLLRSCEGGGAKLLLEGR